MFVRYSTVSFATLGAWTLSCIRIFSNKHLCNTWHVIGIKRFFISVYPPITPVTFLPLFSWCLAWHCAYFSVEVDYERIYHDQGGGSNPCPLHCKPNVLPLCQLNCLVSLKCNVTLISMWVLHKYVILRTDELTCRQCHQDRRWGNFGVIVNFWSPLSILLGFITNGQVSGIFRWGRGHMQISGLVGPPYFPFGPIIDLHRRW